MEPVRLNKHLASLGIASRRESDVLIESGEVKVNGETAVMGMKVDPDIDKIEVSDKVEERREKLIYIVLNKPIGYTCSVKRTEFDPDIVLDLVDIKERIYPVGRLDKDTTGLIILTNDGTLTFALTHPSSECEKEYEVESENEFTNGMIEKLESGMKLWGEKTLPTKIEQINYHKIRIILKEGKNRQIRRICQKVGATVRTLKRIRIKRLKLGELKLGKYRYLSPAEVKMLKK